MPLPAIFIDGGLGFCYNAKKDQHRTGGIIWDGKVRNVQFIGGCNGNLKGIASLVEGMDADAVIERCQGITCGMKRTSCPDQLAQALIAAKNA